MACPLQLTLCGEDAVSRSGSAALEGLTPPQARGARFRQRRQPGAARLIPAGAGSTWTRSCWPSPCPAHPRRRGEHPDRFLARNGLKGSSPQARGARRPLVPGYGTTRLIPAGAGSTRRRWFQAASLWAHPRRRGEHPTMPVIQSLMGGSSPQARGARPCGQHPGVHQRLIPAGAGSTRGSRPTWSPCPAHPRRRGEHTRLYSKSSAFWGSSPQARGAPRLGQDPNHG